VELYLHSHIFMAWVLIKQRISFQCVVL